VATAPTWTSRRQRLTRPNGPRPETAGARPIPGPAGDAGPGRLDAGTPAGPEPAAGLPARSACPSYAALRAQQRVPSGRAPARTAHLAAAAQQQACAEHRPARSRRRIGPLQVPDSRTLRGLTLACLDCASWDGHATRRARHGSAVGKESPGPARAPTIGTCALCAPAAQAAMAQAAMAQAAVAKAAVALAARTRASPRVLAGRPCRRGAPQRSRRPGRRGDLPAVGGDFVAACGRRAAALSRAWRGQMAPAIRSGWRCFEFLQFVTLRSWMTPMCSRRRC
jgi:hypothetical protein